MVAKKVKYENNRQVSTVTNKRILRYDVGLSQAIVSATDYSNASCCITHQETGQGQSN